MKPSELSRNLRVALKSARAIAGPNDAIEIDADGVTVRFFTPKIVKPPFELVPEDAPEQSVVYFIAAPGTGLVKIGKTNCIQNRLYSLRTMSPVKLRLVACAPGYSLRERQFHGLFREHRAHGEWFRVVPEIVKMAHQLRYDHGLPNVPEALKHKEFWEE